ncbi:MAG: hypothetical protein HRU22_18595 [Gammaproteobacteria bacterium]|nr:hypothetical protein [Gammaproteobacteria bacterium]
MMTIFTMIVWIVAISVIGGLIKSYNNKPVQASTSSQDDAIDRLIKINANLNKKITALEERVITLEAIVTDEGYELKQRIGDL